MSVSNTGVWLLKAGGQFIVQEAPMYTPGPDEILVKNKAVAVNPSSFVLSFTIFILQIANICGSGLEDSALWSPNTLP